MSVKKRKYSTQEKLKIAAEALIGHITQNDITKNHGVHGTQINRWKDQLKSKAHEVFARPNKKSEKERTCTELIEELYKKIGQLEMERDWLKKKSEFLD